MSMDDNYMDALDDLDRVSDAEADRIHIEGMDAYKADKGLDDCPYHKDSERADLWKHGWDTAFELESMED